MFFKLLLAFCILMIHFHQSDSNCTRRKNKHIATSAGMVATTRILNKTCPVDWVQYFNRCYFLDQVTSPSLNAEIFCKTKNGTLVIIHNTDEMNFISNTFRPYSYFEFHVGAKATGYLTFAWNDNTPLPKNSTYWGSGEPNNYYGNITNINEGCVIGVNYLNGIVYLKDIPCTKYWCSLICEKPVEYV